MKQWYQSRIIIFSAIFLIIWICSYASGWAAGDTVLIIGACQSLMAVLFRLDTTSKIDTGHGPDDRRLP